MSSSCPKCSKPLSVQDVVVKTAHFVRKLQTCGRIIVEAKGQLNAAVIHAQQGVEVIGSIEGNVTCGGAVSIGPKAKWKGDCRARALSVAGGATISRGFFQVPFDPFAPENAGLHDQVEDEEVIAEAAEGSAAAPPRAIKAISTRRPREVEAAPAAPAAGPASEAEAKPVKPADSEAKEKATEPQPGEAETRPVKKISTRKPPPSSSPQVTINKPPSAKPPAMGKPPKGGKKKR